MQTKSKIQLILERNKIKESFGEGLISLMDKYNIKDNVFINNNGFVKEFTKGYFEVSDEYNTITEALKNCDIFTQGIRIINNEKFQVGKACQMLSECDCEKPIMDISQNSYVY